MLAAVSQWKKHKSRLAIWIFFLVAVVAVFLGVSNNNLAQEEKKNHHLKTTTPIQQKGASTQQAVLVPRNNNSDNNDDNKKLHPLHWCGFSWDDFLQGINNNTNSTSQEMFLFPNNDASPTTSGNDQQQPRLPRVPLVWTVSGGPEYRSHIGVLIQKWRETLGMTMMAGSDGASSSSPRLILVVALDLETAETVCQLSYANVAAVHWDAPPQSYSRVADSKFGVASALAGMGVNALFQEMDVFCRRSPLSMILDQPKLLDEQAPALKHVNDTKDLDLMYSVHGDFSMRINIGLYYVRASPYTRDFFASLQALLVESKTERKFLQNNNVVHWFDQTVFQRCLERYTIINHKKLLVWQRYTNATTTNASEAVDPASSENFLDRCSPSSVKMTSAALSNLYISACSPPLVMDSTVCIHPLAKAPFSPFVHKLAVAKILGFDPEEIHQEERFLKVVSGEITYVQNWNVGFNDGFGNDDGLLFKYHLALLVYLAQQTNRTLILPRHIRGRNKDTYPIHALLDVVSVEDLGVRWRYLLPNQGQELQENGKFFGVQNNNSANVAVVDLERNQSPEYILNATKTRCGANVAVCAVHGIFRIGFHKDVKAHVDKLTWCFQKQPQLAAQKMGTFAALCTKDQQDRPRPK